MSLKNRIFHTISPDKIKIPTPLRKESTFNHLIDVSIQCDIMSQLFVYKIKSDSPCTHQRLRQTTHQRFEIEMTGASSEKTPWYLMPADDVFEDCFFAIIGADWGNESFFSFGGVAIRTHFHHKMKELSWAWIHPNLRRKGILKSMINHIEKTHFNELPLEFAQPFSDQMTSFLKKHRAEYFRSLNI